MFSATEIQDKLALLVRDNLDGAELLDWHLVEHSAREARYVVRWRRNPNSLGRGEMYGTHVAMIALDRLPGLGPDILVWGRYDMDDGTSMRDYRKRRGF